MDDVLNDFYIPSLSNSIKYKRLSGFFTSSSLAVAARGISNFIKNDGHMELICSAKLKKEDLESIKMAYKSPEEVISNSILFDLDNLEEGLVKDHVSALGWMIANGTLTIKIAISYDDKGNPLNDNQGMFHLKTGILIDDENNMLSFSGSINESAFGWKYNVEEFKVFRQWENNEKDYFDSDLKKFTDYWNGKTKRIKIYDMPEAVKNKLISISPKNIDDITFEDIEVPKDNKHLWIHQKKAIENWEKCGLKGILAMATGTGKTITALGCLEELFKQKNKIFAIISCPYAHLVDQWEEELYSYGIENEIIIASGSINSNWKKDLNKGISYFKKDIIDKFIIVTTHDTLSSNHFISIMNQIESDILLIADEVHGNGSKKRRKGLLDNYEYRLGLSATPTRYFDDEGTDIILDYFGGTVFTFSIEDALNTINPDTNEFFLTPYEYMPCFVNLTDSEIIEYEKITKKLVRLYNMVKDEEDKHETLNQLLFKRQRIINNAVNKYEILRNVLKSQEDLKYCLIYCSPQQLDKVRDILEQENIRPYTKFTMEEGTKKEKRFGGLSERQNILNEFEKGEYKVLVAMKCLDEGVDVPSARIAIIMSSSSNPREYIQRRGRILRRAKNKERAIIYDLVVFPKPNESNLLEIEKKIRKKEIQRYREFSSTAINAAECLSKLRDI